MGLFIFVVRFDRCLWHLDLSRSLQVMRINSNGQETTYLAVKEAGLKATGKDIVG